MIHLTDEPARELVLERDTEVTGLQRFIERGGSVRTNGYRLLCVDPLVLDGHVLAEGRHDDVARDVHPFRL